MNIVFYSTCSTLFDGTTFHYENLPLNKSKLETLIKLYSEHNFSIVSQLPGMFLLDLSGNELEQKANNINYELLPSDATTNEISEKILSLNPSVVISITGFFRPFDWQGIKDGLIAQQLIQSGIKVLANSVQTQNICFDKILTQNFLEANNFSVPKSFSVDHELFWAERNNLDVKENLYKEYIFSKLQQMNYPIIIKDATGLSSFGMEVVTTVNQAKAFLTSKKNNGNKLIQELIEGQQFGVEVFGTPENYMISSPFQFSVNQYKITSPKQSVKAGPVVNQKFSDDNFYSELSRLCTLLNINGSAQIDLVYSNSKWYIIEINPRISGMTNTVCQSYNTNYLELLVKAALNIKLRKDDYKNQCVLSLKLPIIDEKTKNSLLTHTFIKQINQTKNDNAKQHREAGFCEIIIEGKNSTELKLNLDIIKQNYSELIDPGFYTQSIQLLKDME